VETNDLLVRLLQGTDLRAKVLASNLANQNTPAYVRRVVTFEDTLRATLNQGGDISRVEPKVEMDVLSPARPDGNNVTLELEMNAFRENRILYDTFVAMLRGHFSVLETAITGGR